VAWQACLLAVSCRSLLLLLLLWLLLTWLPLQLL
jgi:hypothetical protein